MRTEESAMCVSATAARFSGTVLYHGQVNHAEHGRVHVLGYQNTAVSLAAGPNAMLLHLPGRVLGRKFIGLMPNGDFEIPYTDVMRGDLSALRRTSPLAA